MTGQYEKDTFQKSICKLSNRANEHIEVVHLPAAPISPVASPQVQETSEVRTFDQGLRPEDIPKVSVGDITAPPAQPEAEASEAFPPTTNMIL